MREYIVCCKSREDLQNLYDDMETPGGSLYIPDREVQLAHRRPISRNTHYMLTDEEAALVRQDDRVLAVELTMEETGLEFTPYYTISSEFTDEEKEELKSEPEWSETSNRWHKGTLDWYTYRNWGLLRCRKGDTYPNWGVGGDEYTAAGNTEVLVTASGKNVDVVIVDGCIDPGHPEFAVNSDGTGGSRVNQFNWFSLNPDVTGANAGTYLYTDGGLGDYTTGGQQQDDNNHGVHVGGTVAGNTQGWARDANVFNMNPYGTAPSGISNALQIDYIRQWHNTKDANPETGFRNPTITNHSYGVTVRPSVSDVSSITWRGITVNNPTTQQLEDFGISVSGGLAPFNIYYTTRDADITDAIQDGILFVAASGNNDCEIDIQGGVDHDNYATYQITISGTVYNLINEYYNRGSSPSCPGVINVGNVDATVLEQKSNSSNCGQGVHVFAPGTNIISSVLSGGRQDQRNTSYRLDKFNGTSMASPQVAGVLACIAEHWPRMTQYEALSYFNAQNPWTNTFLATTDQLSNQEISGNYDYLYFNVTASGSSNYTIGGGNFGNNQSDPTITINAGNSIRFNLSCSGHPFVLKWDSTGGSYSGDSGYDHDLMNFSNDSNYPFSSVTGFPNIWHEDTNGVKNYTSTMFQQTTGTLVWDTNDMLPGTYYYQCAAHSNMWGEIVIQANTNSRNLHNAPNRYLFMPNIRRITNGPGQAAVGAVANPQQSWPRLDNKFRPILNFAYDVGGRDVSTIDGGDIDEDIYGTSKMIYPRHPIWNRRPTN